MSIIKKLEAEGISVGGPGNDIDTSKKYEVRVNCPKKYCQESRDKSERLPLKLEIIQDYAQWRCRHCLWSGHIGDPPVEVSAAPDPVPEQVEQPNAPGFSQAALTFLAAKGMTGEDAIKRKLTFDDKRGIIKVPYFDGANEINALLIDIKSGKTKLKNDKAVFFGLERLTHDAEPIIIAQSEIDAIVIEARGFTNVLALPNGGAVKTKGDEYDQEPDKFGYLAEASKLVKEWASVKFVLDDTPQGLAYRQELARRIGPGKCTSVKLSFQSVSQTMIRGGSDVLCADIQEAKALPIFGLFEVDDFQKELMAYFEYGMAAGVPTGWANVDKLYTVVPGQLTVVTGIPNSGKSEWVDALSVNLAMQCGWRFAAFSPENGKEAHATKLIEKRVEQSADPKDNMRMSMDTFMSGAKWVKNHYSFIESTDVMPTLDWILDRARDAALRYGIKGLVIDPWNRIEKKLGERQSETDYVAESIPKILRFLVNYGVHGWLVVHPKQQQPDHKTGKIRAPSLYDMAGSAHFVNMCDNGVVIHRSDSIDDTTEVLVRKVRFKHVGRRGETKLRYNRHTGRYEPLEEEAMTAEQYATKDDTDGIRTYEVD